MLCSDQQVLADKTLADVIAETQLALGPNLISALVFGSAATGQLRATSDVNLMLVVKTFNPAEFTKLRESLRVARALVQLQVMFIQEDELPVAAHAFALKFSDILRRHKILYGANVLANIQICRNELLATIRQSLLNLRLRGREQYLLLGLREEQLVKVIADSAAPLRACAAGLRFLEGLPPLDGKQALEEFVAALKQPELTAALQHLSTAREEGHLPPGQGAETFLQLLDIGQQLQLHSDRQHDLARATDQE